MKIIYLPKDEAVISTVASWLHSEFWSKKATLEFVSALVRANASSQGIPLTLVALNSQGVPVGTASLIECDLETRKDLSPWLAGVYVVPEARGQGIASMLCDRVAEDLKRLGLNSAYLYTVNQQSLYQRCGWRELCVENSGSVRGNIMKLVIPSEE